MLDVFKSGQVAVHRPNVGEYQKLECEPPYSYPKPSVYWGIGSEDENLKDVETDIRVIKDYDGMYANDV